MRSTCFGEEFSAKSRTVGLFHGQDEKQLYVQADYC
jgi:hypothetical protein